MVITLVVFLVAIGVLYLRSLSSRDLPEDENTSSSHAPLKVLILTAAVGGGHEAAGQTVRAELERAGCDVTTADGLRTMSRTLSWLLNRGYCSQVRNTPKSLGTVFAVTSRRAGAAAVRVTVSLLFAKRLLKLVREENPDLVVSTYPLVNAALGHLRSSGKLQVPAAAIIADYGVHPLWVSPTLDLHLVVSGSSAELSERAGGNATMVRIPAAAGFYSAPTREEARTILGLPPKAFVALVVGGAWGIGDLGGATRCAAKSGVHTVVVTGTNAALKAHLEERFEPEEKVRILGWREDMPVLMAAADCLIQNAGGMTCIEAIEMGLPIIIFNPILGHGELNAQVMEMEGAAHRVRNTEELGALLRSAARRETFLPAPKRELAAPTVSEALESLAGRARQPARPRRLLRPRPVMVGVSLLALLSWLTLAPTGVALASREFSTPIPGYSPSSGKVALGVRVTDPATAAALESSMEREQVPATIFTDARAAESLRPAGGLTFGVAEESGDKGTVLPWRARSQTRTTAATILLNTGSQPEYFLPASRTNLASLTKAPPHTRLVMPETSAGDPRPGLLVVDTSGLDPGAARLKFDRALQEIQNEDLRCVPLAEL